MIRKLIKGAYAPFILIPASALYWVLLWLLMTWIGVK